MSTDQNIQERAEKHAGQQAPFKNKREREMFVDGYIDGATKERELMSSHKEAAEATILRLYDAIPDNKEELVMLFNLGAEYGRDMSNQWVSVESDELPPMEIKTQIICADGEQYIGYFNGADRLGHVWFCDNNDYHYPTHWMPLPSPPVIKKG